MAFNPKKLVDELRKAGVLNMDATLDTVLTAAVAGLEGDESADVTIAALTKYAVVLPVAEAAEAVQ